MIAPSPLSPNAAMFSGPIPGASLTRAPGSVPWEKPPQFTKLDDAIMFVLKQLEKPDVTHHFLAVMESGAPLDVVVYTVLGHGFSEGLWTPSLGILMIKPLVALFKNLLETAKIKYIPSYNPQKGKLDDLFAMANARKKATEISEAKGKALIAAAKAKEASMSDNTSSNVLQSNGIMSPQGASMNG